MSDAALVTIDDLARRARRRIPGFAFDYVEAGTGRETCVARNRASLDAVTLLPRYMMGGMDVDLSTTVLGQRFAFPFGVAPMGLGGLVWPDSEAMLARAARSARIPYVLSTVACAGMERIAEIAGESAWFQLYPPNDPVVFDGLLARARNAGFHTLVVTVDVPVAGRRERDMRNGLSVPPRFSPRTIWQSALRPAWSLATLEAGLPRFRTLEPYMPPGASLTGVAGFVGKLVQGSVTWERLERIRREWPRALVVKGILHPADAARAVAIGADGLIVSNHGGRQLDAAPAPLERLPAIADAAGAGTTLMVDGGVASGLDVARCLAAGARFVFCGRAFMYGVAALGPQGGSKVVEILGDGLRQTLAQIGCPAVADLGPAWLAE